MERWKRPARRPDAVSDPAARRLLSGEACEEDAKRLMTGAAWEDFCDNLKNAGRIVEEFGDVASDQDRAEWYRFLSRMVRNGFERFVENCEPERPRLRDAPWRQSINVQHPDQDHLMCELVDGSHDYRIYGNRGGLPYFVMATWTAPQPDDFGARDWAPLGTAGLELFDPSDLSTTSFLASGDIDFDAEGNFEVLVSQRPRERNWLQLSPDTTGILIRSVHHRRAEEADAVMQIERLDQPSPRPTTPDEVSRGLAKAGQAVLGYAELVRAWWHDNLSKRPNEIVFSENTYLSNGGVLDRLHGFGSWHKPSGSALVIDFHPPPCESWILQLCNLWQENLDVYEDAQGYLTKFNARYEGDGSVRVVVADDDPGLGGNWIDSFQHQSGVFSLRVIQTEGGSPVTIRSVPLERLRTEGFTCLKGIPSVQSGAVTD